MVQARRLFCVTGLVLLLLAPPARAGWTPRCQFGLKALLITTAVVGGLLGWRQFEHAPRAAAWKSWQEVDALSKLGMRPEALDDYISDPQRRKAVIDNYARYVANFGFIDNQNLLPPLEGLLRFYPQLQSQAEPFPIKSVDEMKKYLGQEEWSKTLKETKTPGFPMIKPLYRMRMSSFENLWARLMHEMEQDSVYQTMPGRTEGSVNGNDLAFAIQGAWVFAPRTPKKEEGTTTFTVRRSTDGAVYYDKVTSTGPVTQTIANMQSGNIILERLQRQHGRRSAEVIVGLLEKPGSQEALEKLDVGFPSSSWFRKLPKEDKVKVVRHALLFGVDLRPAKVDGVEIDGYAINKAVTQIFEQSQPRREDGAQVDLEAMMREFMENQIPQ